ncbi:unnamed protein product [Ixodes persulcatus]
MWIKLYQTHYVMYGKTKGLGNWVPALEGQHIHISKLSFLKHEQENMKKSKKNGQLQELVFKVTEKYLHIFRGKFTDRGIYCRARSCKVSSAAVYLEIQLEPELPSLPIQLPVSGLWPNYMADHYELCDRSLTLDNASELERSTRAQKNSAM